MGLPQVNTCCCGCSLKTGSCIIGFLSAIGSLSSTITTSLYAQNLSPTSFDYDRDYSFAVCQAILSACMLLTNVLLVVGAIQEKPSYVKPWIILNSIILTIQAAMYLGVFILLLVYGAEVGVVLGFIVAFFIIFCIAFYFLVVVSSFHKSLLAANIIFHSQPPHNPATMAPNPVYPYPPSYSLPRVQVVPVAVSPPPYPSATQVTVQGLVVVQEEHNADPYAKY